MQRKPGLRSKTITQRSPWSRGTQRQARGAHTVPLRSPLLRELRVEKDQ
jgi:hypothetical protein